MTERRADPLTGSISFINADRQARPNLPATSCPFCPGGLEAPEPYDVRWFPNRWPAIEGDRCEVVLYTSDHDASLATLDLDQAARIVDLWAERTAALGSRDDVAYVLVFENRGPQVGATISHPHGQIYAYAEVPPVPARELDTDVCSLCNAEIGPLVVATRASWRAWVPAASVWPFELLLVPDDHPCDLNDPSARRDELGSLLVQCVGALDALFDEPMPYMLWVHQRPTDGGAWPTAHLHVHIAPTYRAPGTARFVAAAEVGGGAYFNPVAPEDAAARLRAALWPEATATIDALGETVAWFDEHHSGCRSMGVETGTGRVFVKHYAEPRARRAFDRMVAVHGAVTHPALPPLLHTTHTADGPVAVFAWVDGEPVGKAGPRWSALPLPERLAGIDALLDVHLAVVDAGFVAVDLYYGSLLYDYDAKQLFVCDLDLYRRGPFTVERDRMPGSRSVMAPEELIRGATIDQRTTVCNLARLSALLLGDDLSPGLRAVVARGSEPDPADRHPDVSTFVADWRSAAAR